jgi:hypothetical protein
VQFSNGYAAAEQCVGRNSAGYSVNGFLGVTATRTINEAKASTAWCMT